MLQIKSFPPTEEALKEAEWPSLLLYLVLLFVMKARSIDGEFILLTCGAQEDSGTQSTLLS
jgi:hypothetical protein